MATPLPPPSPFSHPAPDARRQANHMTGAYAPTPGGSARWDATGAALPSLHHRPPPPPPPSNDTNHARGAPYHAEEVTAGLQNLNFNAAQSGPGWPQSDRITSTAVPVQRESGIYDLYMPDASSTHAPPSTMDRVSSVRRPLPPTPGSTSTFPSDSVVRLFFCPNVSALVADR